MVRFLSAFALSLFLATPAWAISGSSLTQKSSGTTVGSAFRLNDNGFVGTYLTLTEPREVKVKVSALGVSSGSIDPRMSIVIDDTIASFVVGSSSALYEPVFSLPAGTHFIRTQFDNDPSMSARSLTVNSLEVVDAGTEASLSLNNSNSNSNALAAANSYINNYRKGAVALELVGASPGADVQVKLKRHDFNFGAIASGTTSFPDLINNPSPGSNAYNYQQFVANHFNSLVPSNGGKWTYNEPHQDQHTLNTLDSFLNYTSDPDNNLRARMHNLAWETNQQPYWVCCFNGNGLLDVAKAGGPGAAAAKEQLRQEIIERIDYYVRQRADQYVEIDVINESLHQEGYWEVFGAAGFAEIFNEVADALDDAGSDAKAMLNEFNVLQWSEHPLNSTGSDPYANWYREHIDEVTAAGGEMSGVGVQYYADRRQSGGAGGIGGNAHSAARIMQAYQNLAVTGLPISLTEFDVIKNPGDPTAALNWTWASQIMEETMRMTFGMPDANSFMIWGLTSANSEDFGLVSTNYLTLTEGGERWEDLMAEWDTDLMLEVGLDGMIDFTGFYGDYEITINGETFELSLVKGTSGYSLVVGEVLPGDYNGDGKVSAADYTVWRDTVGSTTDLRANGDNTDGSMDVVDEADYDVWLANYGNSSSMGAGSIASLSVPEPANLDLAIFGLIIAIYSWVSTCRERRPWRSNCISRSGTEAVPYSNQTTCPLSLRVRS